MSYSASTVGTTVFCVLDFVVCGPAGGIRAYERRGATDSRLLGGLRLQCGSARCSVASPIRRRGSLQPRFSARQVVLLVLDGLGWQQMAERRSITPSLHALTGGPISTVVPTTTATAMTSITTGLSPGQHGVIGYRMAVDDEVLNVLRWSTPRGDARKVIRPSDIQKAAPFHGERPPIVTRADFSGGGFSAAHLDGVRFHGYRTAATMVHEVRTACRCR